jgi:hypothetical protein
LSAQVFPITGLGAHAYPPNWLIERTTISCPDLIRLRGDLFHIHGIDPSIPAFIGPTDALLLELGHIRHEVKHEPVFRIVKPLGRCFRSSSCEAGRGSVLAPSKLSEKKVVVGVAPAVTR